MSSKITQMSPEEIECWRKLREERWVFYKGLCPMCGREMALDQMELHHIKKVYYRGGWETKRDVIPYCKIPLYFNGELYPGGCHEIVTNVRRTLRYLDDGPKTPTPYERSTPAVGTSVKRDELGEDDLQGSNGYVPSKMKRDNHTSNRLDETQGGYQRKTPKRSK